MRYQEYQPPTDLAPWIKLFWVFEGFSEEVEAETIVADGFPELIIHFRSPFAEEDRAGKLLPQPTAIACGQLTKPLILHSSLEAGMVGIRFQPGGMAPFVSSPMHAITDSRTSAENLFVDMDRLIEEVKDATDDAQRIAACCQYLFRSIDYDRENASLRKALERIKLNRGHISVEALANLCGISRRSLELAFKKDVGTSPKMFCRITRFRYLFDTLSEDDFSPDWIQIALDAGFFDQSHLIRDFRRFTGDSPTAFLAEQTTFAQSVNQA